MGAGERVLSEGRSERRSVSCLIDRVTPATTTWYCRAYRYSSMWSYWTPRILKRPESKLLKTTLQTAVRNSGSGTVRVITKLLL